MWQELPGQCRKLHNEELHNLACSMDGREKHAFEALLQISERKKPLEYVGIDWMIILK
jgi:hypothetical protein